MISWTVSICETPLELPRYNLERLSRNRSPARPFCGNYSESVMTDKEPISQVSHSKEQSLAGVPLKFFIKFALTALAQ